ncbi:thiamine phosphate synthase [Sphingobacterium deserti]|uniref:Thiamine-phosphate synthase n=1 Tax=Sphingobacterium deserti TaxID=1229276 RepID=A0A0B8SZE6_9SPHI|nr:thiamine phosphate synthase [Sphingobacterium deserti]KGE13127.1 thiamine-phosphate diphosphorylase [Sphingobacterium deserti]
MNISPIQYISSGVNAEQHFQHIQQALRQGVDWIQLRLKDSNTAEKVSLARRILELKKQYTFTFIINDDVAAVAETDADGVHLGLNDMPVVEARKILHTEKIIGGTANTLPDVLQRIDEGCNYIGLGPLRQTTTKEKLSPILGFAGYASIIDAIDLALAPPIVAIGGIADLDIPPLKEIGLYGIALSKHMQDNFYNPQYMVYLNKLIHEHETKHRR